MDLGERHDAKKAERAADQSQNGVRGADWLESIDVKLIIES